MMCSVAAGEIEITQIKVEDNGEWTEWWNAGVLGRIPITIFQYSITPTVLCATAHEKQDNENWYGYAKEP